MKITQHLTIPASTPNPVRRTYGFGVPHMVKYYNMDTQTDGRGIGNYSRLDYAMWDGVKAQNGGRQAPLVLTDKAMKFIEAIQPKDEHGVVVKMNWFGRDKARGDGRPCWKDGSVHKCDSIVYGDALVSVTNTYYDFELEFLTDDRLGKNIIERARFYKLNHFKLAMMDMELGEYQDFEYPFVANGKTLTLRTLVRRSVIPLINDGLIQVATQANAKPAHNTINATERGVKLFPVFDPSETAQYRGYEYVIWDKAFQGH